MRLRRSSLAVLVLLSGCAVSRTWINPETTPPAAPVALSDSIDVSLFLVGDAGKPLVDRPEPVLEALVQEASVSPDNSWIVFLGDNIYPDGIPQNADSRKGRKAVAALRTLVEAAVRTGAETVFLPGNHDHHSGGFAAVARQAEAIDAYGNPRIRMLPEPGCPGPEIIDVGTTLRLILLDSEWWIAKKRRPDTPQSCDNRTADEVTSAVREALESADGRHTIVLAHHPLATHGAHGGFFSWREHLFPLVRWKSWLWVPIPILSSMYVATRVWGGYAQDLGGSHYQEMNGRLSAAYDGHEPLIHAGGHEHSLQVLERSFNAQWNLVSGAGTVKRPDEVGKGEDTVFVSPKAGFLRLDLLLDGRVRLLVTEVTKQNQVMHPFSVWLPEHPPQTAQ